jgi:hypothetical protein
MARDQPLVASRILPSLGNLKRLVRPSRQAGGLLPTVTSFRKGPAPSREPDLTPGRFLRARGNAVQAALL